MDSNLRETLRRRHEARLATERAAREAEERAAREAEEAAAREARRQAEEQEERLLPLIQLQGELNDLTAIVRTARSPGQVIPLLRRVANNIFDLYQPDLPGSQELVGAVQAAVMELVLAFNDNEALVLQVGSYEFRTIQELVQNITAATGVDIEIAAPVMDTSRDEEIARQLAGPALAPMAAPAPMAAAAASSSSSSRVSPVRVPELEEYQQLLTQLRTMRYASQAQVQSILRQIPPPPEGLEARTRNQLRTLLENLRAYITNRWASAYNLSAELETLSEFIEDLII